MAAPPMANPPAAACCFAAPASASATQLEERLRNMEAEVARRDERLRLARQAGSLQADLIEEELRTAEEELASEEETKAHADLELRAKLASAETFAAIDYGATELLIKANAERFAAETRHAARLISPYLPLPCLIPYLTPYTPYRAGASADLTPL